MAKLIHHLFGNNKKQHLQMRSRLVATSPELVSIKQANEIKVEDVTERGQVSRDTFYKCFRSVDDLLQVSAKQVGHEIITPVILTGSSIQDISVRVATKTRLVMQMTTKMPLLGQLMLNAEWPFKDLQYKALKDIKKDVALGIEQGCFTDMPLEIAANLVLVTLRGAVQEMLASPQTQEYEDQVIYHLLLSLGVDSIKAKDISKIPLDHFPDLPKKGLIGKILKMVA